MASQIEVAQIMAVIGSAYPNFTVTKETVQVYFDLLNDLPVDLLRAATLKCCGEAGRKFAPSVGEIRGASAELMARAGGVPSTLEAWNEVSNKTKPRDPRFPLYRDGVIIENEPVMWSHLLVEKVAMMLGFPDFPDPENEGVERAHFFKQYEAELQRYSGENRHWFCRIFRKRFSAGNPVAVGIFAGSAD